jgi:hypothetical protein
METNLISSGYSKVAPNRERLSLSRPSTLQPGRMYLRCSLDSTTNSPILTRVRLVDYDACAAFVIVRGPSNERLRCPRDELFEAQRWPISNL